MLAYSEGVHRSALMLKIMIITNYHDAELQPHNLSHGVAWTLFSVAPSNDNIVSNLHNQRTPFLELYKGCSFLGGNDRTWINRTLGARLTLNQS